MRRIIRPVMAGVIASVLFEVISPAAASAMDLDVYGAYDTASISECVGKAHAGQRAYVQTRVGTEGWVNRNRAIVDKRGCVNEVFFPADLAGPSVGQIAVRVYGKPARMKGKRVAGFRTAETGYRVWASPASSRDLVPHLDAFVERYGDSVATIICDNPRSGGSQGTGVSVPATLVPDTQNYLPGATTLLATAGHVLDECFYDTHFSVTVLYNGQSYPGVSWTRRTDRDIGSVITTAPVPPATLAIGPDKRPQIGDAAIAIGVASGVTDTTTQGVISGVSQTEINTTVPSGHGASGGPMFNNRGEVVGLVVAGNGSLTVATALPAFCESVYAAVWCSSPVWP